jgi:ATP-dependent helicase/nuclease subunit B
VAVETAAPRLVEADGLEGEARATVLEVLQALRGGHVPVALIALDRVLVRRVRALLERCNVALADETGWALSTTRAAARLMAMLRAAAAGATADDRLEWLKALPPDRVPADAVQRLETAWRAGRDVDARRDPGAADALAFATASLVPLSPDGGPRRRPLATWLRALEGALGASALGEALAQDPAGRQALAALGVGPQAPAGLARAAALGAEIVDLDGFGGWVDRVLESATFVPAALGQAEVVLTPLARAVMRPFGAAVLAGADESRLGVAEPARGLIGPAAMAALGLDGAAERLRRDRAAFAQLLRLGTVAVVRRRADGDEPVGPSPFVAALSLARRHAGLPPLASAPSNGPLRRVDPSPVHRPAPVPGAVLPAELSATAVERLRQCPYRFFARSVLGLGEADELARELDQRDYGNWLHAALHRFHRERTAAASTVDDDARALRQAAAQAAAEAGLDPAALLPFRAAFERLLPAYLAWLHGRDVAGARWQDGETRRERSADALGGVRLAGRIDRIDRGADGAAELIDYKTGRPEKFKVLVRRNRYEDTQLAFYALLVGADEADAAKVRAAYLPLDSGEAIATIEHPEVADSARALLAGLAHDLARLRAGAGLPALGESPVCDHCEARGLCRRDHWHGPPEAAG